MEYVIAYMDGHKNSAQLAQEIRQILSPAKVKMLDLNEFQGTVEFDDADMYYICFDCNRYMIPLEVMELLLELEGKSYAFIVTSGFAEADFFEERLEQELKAFLPDRGENRGLFLCGGEFPSDVVMNAKEILAKDSDNAHAKFVIANHQKTCNRPDSSDITDLWGFIEKRKN